MSLTSEQRSNLARDAVNSRWAKRALTNGLKMQCRHGHDLSDINSWSTGPHNQQICRRCQNEASHRYKTKNRNIVNLKAKEYGLRRNREIRNQVIEKLGRVCIRCGFSDIRALQVDHINGGGQKELRGPGGPHAVMKKVLKDPTGYQLLCANCNWIKRAENNEVPKPFSQRS